MLYTITLYGSLVIFSVGILYKISNWFRYQIEPGEDRIKPMHRVSAAFRGIAATLFSRKIVLLLRVFIKDIIFQKYFMKVGMLRWSAHMCIYIGFILLLLTHALETVIMEPVFDSYYSTIFPYIFIRNFLGAVIIAGLVIALIRRMYSPMPRPKSTFADYIAIFILAVIMISGIGLEASKILSNTVYTEMVNEYSGLNEEDTESLQALNAYWVDQFGVVSPGFEGPFDALILKAGEEIHQESCMSCHSPPQWAFMSYGLSRALKPAAAMMDRAGIHTFFWYLHFLLCFAGLAYLPFSKFFHMFSTPVHLLMREVMAEGGNNPANISTMNAIALDACVHCGDCTRRCSVAVAMNEIPNPNILPSEKHAAFRSLLSGRNISKKKLIAIQEGSYICTDCHRCTDVCPVGLDLEVLWRSLKQHVANLGYPKPEAWARKAIGEDFVMRKFGERSLSPSFLDESFTQDLTSPVSIHTFSRCFGCQNCTSVCPVVATHESPRKALGLLPHEIMHCLALRQKDLVLGSMMLWDCLTCYVCQEQCPQEVLITDVLYQLKNMALKQLKEKA